MTKQPAPEFTQTTMLPPEAVEFIIRIGVVGASSHAQWQLEVRNATDETLLELVSRPHFDVGILDLEIAAIWLRLATFWAMYVVPF
jgi:hypothetical protein